MNINYTPSQFNDVRTKLPDGCQDVILWTRNTGSVAGVAQMKKGYYNYGIDSEEGWWIYDEEANIATLARRPHHMELDVIAWQEIPKVEFEDMPA